jgi:hypothetical protein
VVREINGLGGFVGGMEGMMQVVPPDSGIAGENRARGPETRK